MTQLTIGELLRRHRLDAALTQKELAEMIDYDHSTVSRIERGTQIPKLEYVQRFIEVMKLSDEATQEIWTVFRGEQETSIDELNTALRQDWGEAPDVSAFYGRYEDLVDLTRWLIDDHCRLVAILGMGGIGKTALATKLAKQTADKFDYVIWRSLRNAPPLMEVLTECIQFLSDQQDVEISEETDKGITRLIKYLDAHRCLIIFDNAEAILKGSKAGYYRSGYEDYGDLLQRVGSGQHQSCIVVTSREKPVEVGQLEGVGGPVRSHQLRGLDVDEGKQVLADKRLMGSNEAWTALVRYHSGNPLALNIVAEMIREVYAGDIDNFLLDHRVVIDEIGDVLDTQFNRLSVLEQSLMYWLAIEREPVSREVLFDNLARPVFKPDLNVALRSLRRRSLIEQRETSFTLQNVVMEYVTDRLVIQVSEEFFADKISLYVNHTLVKATAKDYIRDSQHRLILQPVVDRLMMALDAEEIEQKLNKILLAARQQKRSRISDYRGGNTINLLRHLKGQLTGSDFSNLVLRQAYLCDIDLQDANFANSKFVQSVVTEAFGRVHTVAFSPNGQLVLTGASNGEIRLWRVADGEQLFVCPAHVDWVWSVAFSPDGQTFASAGGDQVIRLWNIQTGQCIRTFQEHTNRVRSIAFSPDGTLLASGGDDQFVRIWDVRTGQCISEMAGHTGEIWSLAFSPDGQVVASGGNDHDILLWDVHLGQCFNILWGDIGQVGTVTFNADGQILASSSRDQGICLWDVYQGQKLRNLNRASNEIFSIAFSPDDRLLACSDSDNVIQVWNIQTGQYLQTLYGHQKRIRSVAFSSDGKVLVSGSEDQSVKLWQVNTGQCLRTLRGHANPVWSIAFSPDGDRLASGSEDQKVRIWNVKSGTCDKILKEHTNLVGLVAFSPDGKMLAGGSDDKTIRLWDADTGQWINTLEGHRDWIRSLAFSHKGNILASSSREGPIRLWDPQTGQCLRTLQGHAASIWSIAFSPDDNTLLCGGDDQTLRLWDVNTGQWLRTLSGHSAWVWSVAYSPDGDLLASGSADHTVRLWHPSTGQCLSILRGHTHRVRAIAFSPDGKILASGGFDRTLRLWQVQTGECMHVLEGHSASIWSIAFHPQEDSLASSGDDGAIRLWDVKSGVCLKNLRPDRPYERMNITGVRGLTEAQIATLKTLGAVDHALDSE